MTEQIESAMELWSEEELRAKVGQVRPFHNVAFAKGALNFGRHPLSYQIFIPHGRHHVSSSSVLESMHLYHM